MDALRWAVVLSALVAVSGAWSGRRAGGWHAFWPVPLMAMATVMGLLDLRGLVGQGPAPVTATFLVLGIWAACVVDLVGALEIQVGLRGRSDWQALMAPAFLITVGVALLLQAVRRPEPGNLTSGGVPGVLVLSAGVLLLAGRSLVSFPPALRHLWPLALLLAAVARPSATVDRYAEARQELGLVLAGLQRTGARVVRVDGTVRGRRSPAAVTPAETFRVGDNEVTVYLIGHDDHAGVEAHLSPRVAVPPPSAGVPHLHIAPHILVVCVTADPSFARQLDELVRDLGGRHSQGSVALAMSFSPNSVATLHSGPRR